MGLWVSNLAYDRGVPHYISRKIGHGAGGMGFLLILVFFRSALWPLLLAVLFGLLLLIARLARPVTFRGVGGSGRSDRTFAEVYFPWVAVPVFAIGWLWLDRPELAAETSRNGWWHTGDLARRDEEGFIYIAGRSTDMIKSGTENIYPVEVERVIAMLEGVEHLAHGREVQAEVQQFPGHTEQRFRVSCIGRLDRDGSAHQEPGIQPGEGGIGGRRRLRGCPASVAKYPPTRILPSACTA